MSLLELFQRKITYLAGGIYIPEELVKTDGELLVHISDTPIMSYKAIRRLLRIIEPQWIVHTGDLEDDIKLELSFTKIDLYKKHLKDLINMLRLPNCEVYISMGNHDYLPAVEAMDSGYHLVKRTDTLKAGNLNIAYGHTIELIEDMEADVYLFGHNKYKRTTLDGDGKVYLNGLEQITVIDVTHNKYYFLRYPIGTDDSRLLRMRIGI